MKRANLRRLFVFLIAFPTWILPAVASPATLMSQDQAGQVVAVRNISVKDGTVSGEVVNQSRRPLRDVQLQIRYSWRWKNEFKPGTDDFSGLFYHTIEKEVPPGQSGSFAFTPPSPLPSRPDGYHEVAVSVAGFTEIIQ